MSKTISINNTKFVKSANNVFMTVLGKMQISLQFKIRYDNYFYMADDSHYGSRVIFKEPYIENDIFITVGWGDGFAIHRVNDDGTIGEVYHDQYPFESYAYWDNLTVDKGRKIAYVGSHNKYGIQPYDFSDLNNIQKLTVIKRDTHNILYDRHGKCYWNGIQMVGDWMYHGDFDHEVDGLYRYNPYTDVGEKLSIQNYRTTIRRSIFKYDEVNNRLYVGNRCGGDFLVVLDPETDSPTVINLRLYDIIHTSASAYSMPVIDNDNPNHLYVNARRALIKIDITPVLDGTDTKPVLLGARDPAYINKEPGTWLMCQRERNGLFASPVHGSDFIYVGGDRGRYRSGAWLDQENYLLIGAHRIDSDIFNVDGVYGYTHYQQKRPFYIDYGQIQRLIKSANGTEYWITFGYGWDGYRFYLHKKEDFPNGQEIENDGYIILGDFTLDNNANISSVQLPNLNKLVYQLSGTTFKAYVSNNAGSTWELYDWTASSVHYFGTKGNTVQIKFEFYGDGTKAPHITGLNEHIDVLLNEDLPIDNNKLIRRALLKIRGRR